MKKKKKRKMENSKRRNMELIKFRLKRGCNYMSRRTVLDYTWNKFWMFLFFLPLFFFAKLIKRSVCGLGIWNTRVYVYSDYNVIGLYERILSLTAFNSINILLDMERFIFLCSYKIPIMWSEWPSKKVKFNCNLIRVTNAYIYNVTLFP